MFSTLELSNTTNMNQHKIKKYTNPMFPSLKLMIKNQVANYFVYSSTIQTKSLISIMYK